MRSILFDIIITAGLLFICGFVFADATEPEEPDFILPEVILELEDLSTESLDAIVPEEELALPEGSVNLPVPEDIEIELPVPREEAELLDAFAPEEAESPLSAEISIGAGLVNLLTGRISIFNPTGDFRYRFVFDHHTVDGYSFLPAGTGYSKRNDTLEGFLKQVADKLGIELGGSFTEKENGLQGQSGAYSESMRFFSGSALLAYSPVELFTLSTRAFGGYSVYSLTGDTGSGYGGHKELGLSGSVAGDFSFSPGKAGLSVDYSYRNNFDSSISDVHRLYAGGHIGGDFDNGFSVLAKAGYFLNSRGAWYIPFEGSVSGVISDKLSIGLNGGFRVIQNNAKTILDTFLYTMPPEFISDTSGWFGSGNAKVNVLDALLVTLEGGVSSDSMIYKQSGMDLATGLFTIEEVSNPFSLNFGGGLSWNPSDWLTISAKNKNTLFLNVPVALRTEISGNAKMSLADDAFAADCIVTLPLDFERPDFLPFVNLDLQARLAPHVRASLEGRDLLAPLVDNKRYIRDPYISEGIQVIFKILVNF